MKKIIIVFITIILVILFAIFFLVSNNDKYLDSLEKEIKSNYELEDEIKYLNKSNLYYIILTTKNLIILDNDYEEIFKESVNRLKKINNGYELVYRLNEIMYEEKNVFEDKIIYNYYNIYTNELIDIVEIGG